MGIIRAACNDAEFGKWGTWSEEGSVPIFAECTEGSLVCGFSQKVEPRQDDDDTALNAVKMFCCEPETPSAAKKIRTLIFEAESAGDAKEAVVAVKVSWISALAVFAVLAVTVAMCVGWRLCRYESVYSKVVSVTDTEENAA